MPFTPLRFTNVCTIFTRYYYQKKLDRLATCVLTLHGLLHVPDNISEAGPIWATWSFVVERYAGSLLPAVKSRLNPYGALAHRVKRLAQLNHIKNLYGLQEQLSFKEPASEVTTKEASFPPCMCTLT